MQAIDFNAGWSYRHLDADEPFAPVHLPHDAMIGERRYDHAAGGINTGWFDGRDYEYTTTFTPDTTMLGKTLILEFEGVYHNAEVWVDDTQLAFRPYGYTNFTVDITDACADGQTHAIRVIARNADQPNSRWYSGAGIYRPVTLWIGDAGHIVPDGIVARTASITPTSDAAMATIADAAIDIVVETTVTGTVSIDIVDAAGAVVATADAVARSIMSVAEGGEPNVVPAGALAAARDAGAAAVAVTRINLTDAACWDCDHPNLYRCVARFTGVNGSHDESMTAFGVRTLEWGDNGILLNGHRVIIQGACIHHDNGVLGACEYVDAVERKIRLLKECGYNAVRSAHNPCSRALLDVCDRLGVLVMDEYIDHWYIHKTQHDYVDYFNEWWQRDLADMVRKDRSHPSVILYSTGNEVSETAQPKGIALTRELTEYLHGIDPTRPVTCGVNIFFNFLSSIGMGVYSDDKAAKEAAEAEKRRAAGEEQQKNKAVGSQFFNDMAGMLGADFMKTGATLPFCDWKTRDAFAAMDVAGYNYGIKRYRHDLKKYPHRLILGSETFCSDAYRFRELAKREPRLVGDFVWAGMDYLGEVGVGSWEYADYAPQFSGFGWLTAGSGRLDLTGRPLGEALYTRVALEAAKGPYIAVCPVNHTGDKHSPSAWKMSNAIDSWSWTGCEGRKANVEVYARAASVALILNGREVGRKPMRNDCIARFTCTYEPGVLEAVAYDESGREIGRCRLVSASEETMLIAEVESVNGALTTAAFAGFGSGGSGQSQMTSASGAVASHDTTLLDGDHRDISIQPGHLCYVRLRYTDANGITKPLERGRITVTVEGGKLLGLGCAAPYNRDSFVSGETGTYYGEALAVVEAPRSDGGSGAVAGSAVMVTATDGNHSTVLTVPVAVADARKER